MFDYVFQFSSVQFIVVQCSSMQFTKKIPHHTKIPTFIPCNKCDFKAHNENHLKKHVSVRHPLKYKAQCIFWLKGFCQMGNQCSFSHESNMCRHGEACVFWPQCKFSHNPCYYQENCLNNECRFQHFLGVPNLNSQTEFPNLTSASRRW